MLVPAIIFITAALVFYTVGVWAERRQGTLKGWHVAMFAAGLFSDATGTWLMSRIADANAGAARDGMTQIMAVTGLVAIILMAVHLAWAAYTLWKGDAEARRKFHKFSVVVWAFWLIPYVFGAASAMM